MIGWMSQKGMNNFKRMKKNLPGKLQKTRNLQMNLTKNLPKNLPKNFKMNKN